MRKNKIHRLSIEPLEQYKKRIESEYSLLQQKIDNYGESSYKIKGFALTVTLGVSYFALKETSLFLPVLGILGMLVFLYYEAINKIHYDNLKSRAYELEKAITNPLRRKKIISPYIAHHLKGFSTIEIISSFRSIKKGWQLHLLYFMMILIFGAIFLRNLCLNIHSICDNILKDILLKIPNI